MEFLELSKYIELEKRGLTAPEVSVIAQQDGLESILVIHVLKSVFELSIDEAQEIYMTTEGSKHPLAFNKELMDILGQINREDSLENQGGKS